MLAINVYYHYHFLTLLHDSNNRLFGFGITFNVALGRLQ